MSHTIKFVHNLYRLSRMVTRQLYYFQNYYFIKHDFDNILSKSSSEIKVDKEVISQFKRRWNWSCTNFIPESYYKVCSFYSRVKSIDIVPGNVYLNSIEPVLNNKLVSEAYADKGSYEKWMDTELLPFTIIKDVNSIQYNGMGEVVDNPSDYLSERIINFNKILIKPTTDSWGGRNVVVFEKRKGKHFHLKTGQEFNYDWLLKQYGTNYIVQEFIDQHPFYKRFNPSSFNSFRVFTYRSVVDNQIHVLHTLLRIGKKGSHVDNISAGGIGCGVTRDGVLYDHALQKDKKKVDCFPSLPELKLSDIGKLHMIDELKQEAVRLAEKIPHTRVIGFDMGIDANNKVRLIEINTDNIGIAPAQLLFGPFFREFTDEVIDYCKRAKKVDIIKIY